ncbi:MAG TPA: hypothetical protein ENJ15_06170 [Caldithrix abyssi]|uniref:Photosynthesis system II assembly factor Ycf48/Hcf136-like domain-containing protein n=1 Tax=Caldithrix abyssi TaxID=187145 RepID=A0A7V5RQ51_CALAY|nr:hypothetical protein [Caldithrix abyssi]
MKYLSIMLLMLTAGISLLRGGVAQSFKLQGGDTPSFLGNATVDLLVHNDQLWASTGFGLNVTRDQGQSWQSFMPGHYPSKGGVSALGFMDDRTLWIATAFDTTAEDQNFSAGGGLSYTRDGGKSWTYIPQPVDAVDETEYAPTTTNIQNITFDIAFHDSTVWIASFGGGLRRSDDMGRSWQVVTPDGQPFNSLNNLKHRAFSVMTENGNIWYGSAEGISKSEDGGLSWRHFTHQNQDRPISGNFVVALAWQEATQTVWAATIEAVDGDEIRAVSKSEDGGNSWDVVLKGVFAHNFGFDGETVFVAADLGLFVSDDRGANWYELPPVVDSSNGEKILDREYFSATSQTVNGRTWWWMGSGDGLASTTDRGNSWRVTRSYISTRQRTSPAVYAYPSPFSPPRSGYTRFQFDISGNTPVEIKIYNWAMEHVRTLNEDEGNWSDGSRDRSVEWDGRDIDGRIVDSGVYFFRADIGGKVTWGKVVVID